MAKRAARNGAATRSPVGEALHLLGDRWTLLILREAFRAGSRRYQQWRNELPISDAVLSARLRDLVAGEVLSLQRYEERPPRSEYRLTDRGLDLWRIMLALWAWESQWVEQSPESALALRHLQCGSDMVPFLQCVTCGEPVTLQNIRTDVTETGWRWLAAPDAGRRRSSTKAVEGDAALFRRETVSILGDRWSSTLIALAFLGVRRFSDFERTVAVSPAVLSDRLRSLTRLGVLELAPVTDRGARKEYRLTAKGLAFLPAVVLVLDWADRWVAGQANRSLQITHLPCGEVLQPGLGCGACGEGVERRSVRFHDRMAPAR